MRRLHLFLVPLFLLALLSGCAKPTAPDQVSGSGAKRGNVSSGAAASVKPVETKEQLEAKAAKGDAEAMFNLGMLYLEGQGVKRDIAQGRAWLEQSAVKGFARAQFNLGVMYYQGSDGVGKDVTKARNWFQSAAKQNDRLALFNLGVMYYRGEGVTQSYSKAREYFILSSAQGYGDAAYNLGVMYAKGEGVTRNTVEAYAWFTIGQAQGNTKSAEVLAGLSSRLTPEEVKTARERSLELAKELEKKTK